MYRVIIVILFIMSISRVALSASGHRRIRTVIDSLIEPRHPAATIGFPETTTCLGCSQKFTITEDDKKEDVQEPDKYLTEDAITALRVEYIKNQILKKLRLKEKPTVETAHLPKPVKENDNLLPRTYEDDEYSRYSDDFYAKTTQAIVFPYEDEARCVRKIRYASACIPLKLPSDLMASDVSSAELWFHKIPDQLDSHNQTFIISEVAHWDTNKSFQKTKPIAITETSLSEGWLKVDVAYVVKNWLQFQDSPTHAINVACKTCGMDTHHSPISFEKSLKPFLVIYTHTQKRRQLRRTKRQLNCGSGVNDCCRQSLYISFADIGWNDWIIHPTGYNAYFCKGSCATAASLTLSGSQHNSLIQKVMYGKGNRKPTKLELKPCCAPTHYDSLQLLYMNDNKTLTTKILTNMIVDSCGCM